MTKNAPAATLTKRIQIVEDETLIAMDLRERLQGLGYFVTSVASTAEDAFRQAVVHAPDLILMDIHLKGTRDGIDSASQIRKALDVPVVYLTAHADGTTIERAKVTGPFGYITKPFETASLHAQIEMAIAKHETERKLRQSEAWLSTTIGNIGEPVVVTDREGHIAYMNPVALELTAWTEAAASGKLIFEVFKLLDPATNDPIADPVFGALHPEGFRALSGEYHLQILNGSMALVQMVVSANKSEDDSLLGVVIVFRDITDRELQLQTRANRNMETTSILAGMSGPRFEQFSDNYLG
jgi:PAS domain S-box-containing protein